MLSRKAPNLVLLPFQMGKNLFKRPEHIIRNFFLFFMPLGNINQKYKVSIFAYFLVLNNELIDNSAAKTK